VCSFQKKEVENDFFSLGMKKSSVKEDVSSANSLLSLSLSLSSPSLPLFVLFCQYIRLCFPFLKLKMMIYVLAFQSAGALLEELKRVSAENKKLTEMLTEMCENYNALRRNLMEYMRKNPEKELTSSKKRKSESSNNNSILMGGNGNSESSSTDEESCKKPKEETIKAKISRVYVRTQQSDTSLVRFFTARKHTNSWSHNHLGLIVIIIIFLGMFLDCERWISVEEIWTKGDQGQPLSKSILQMLFCSKLPGQKEGKSNS